MANQAAQESYTEKNYENAVLYLLEQLGYTYYYGPEVERDYRDPFFPGVLEGSLYAINPGVPEEAINEAIRKLRGIESGSVVERNIIFTDYLQNGIDVSYYRDGEQKADLVRLIDTEHAERNSFIAANQWTFVEHAEQRPDIILFVNGIPLVDIELKSPVREGTDASEAYRQIKNYMKEIPSFYVYNAFCIMSDLAETRAGTITASEDRFMEWKSVDGTVESASHVDFETPIRGMLEPRRLLDLLENFMCYSREEKGARKILACYHQYFAVRKALLSTRNAASEGGDGRGGVFWHTQGSGKSLSMVFYTKLLQRELKSPTVVVITDRNDLDDQLYGQFVKCQEFLRQTPDQAGNSANWTVSAETSDADGGTVGKNFSSREKLRGLLKDREANGIIFTTMQNFVEPGDGKPLSARRNIVVIADEAHRGHYGFEKIQKDGTVHKGIAQIIRDNLPNATFIGFTGTPVASRDHNTREVFGDYIDVYDMTQAVADGATRPVYYESRVIHLRLDQELLRRIDEEYDRMAEETDSYVIEKSKNDLSRMESLLGAPETIAALCDDIIKHYEDGRAQELTGKAMIVAYSRPIAMSIYRKILELRPGWREKIAVVMTGSNNDPAEWAEIVGNKTRRKELAAQFKDDAGPLKIAIVVDMWLTGFDMPSLATMYVYKPMVGHNLMQAIARVNRVFRDKEGGLVVDYVGIASALKQAMNDYTVRDRRNFGEQDVSKAALPKFQEKLEVCRALLHGFDYAGFMESDDLHRANLIAGGADWLFATERAKAKDSFIKEVMAMRQALSLCRSIVPQDERFEAAFFEAVRTTLTRITGKTGHFSLRDVNERINELLKESVRSEGVINLFADVGKKFSLFDPEFLKQVAAMKQKNIAVEILRRLIADQISVYRRTNVVKSELFSEKFQRIMNLYLNGQLTNEEVIQELTSLAHELRRDSEEGKELGLTTEEVAFYDALTKPQAVKDFYSNDQLVAITRELTDMLRRSKTVDWQKRSGARAKMRMMVKRLLKKYKYPPDGQEEALKTVMSQCEMWTDNTDLSAAANEEE
ncbi:MAG: type I restriction endonuclease subunit R [Lentisphaeria bacterium]|nr:type I restriction endonuclease subunit R [Lentisphaeria bacterium]